MTLFLTGLLVGLGGGFLLATRAFNHATKSVAKALLMESEQCQAYGHPRSRI